jgi:hypothetical protein
MITRVLGSRGWVRHSLFARLALLAVFVLTLAAPAPGAAHNQAAQAEPAAIGPQATATVNGTVDGNSVNGVTVYLEDPQSGTVLDTQITNLAGGFTFSNVPFPGRYEVVAVPPAGSPDAAASSFFSVSTPVLNLPVLFMPPASNTISGVVQLNGAPQIGVTVVAYSQDIWQYSRTAVTVSLGHYSISVGAGRWSVYVQQAAGVNWVANQPPFEVTFFGNTATRDISLDPVAGHITGQVVDPNGNTLSFAAGTASLNLDGSDGASPSQTLAANGTFDIPVAAGRYDYSVWLNQTTPAYQNLLGPLPAAVEVISTNVSLGQIRLRARGATISGTVTDGSAPVAGLDVVAWSDDGEQLSTATAGNGSYSIAVPPGFWSVMPSLADSGFLYSSALARAGNVAVGQPLTANFTLARATSTIVGTVVDASNGDPLGDIEGWAYARRPGAAEDLSVAPVISGTFTLPAPAETVQVGLYLDQDSAFTLAAPVSVPPGAAQRPAELQLAANSATIAGRVLDAAQQPAPGLAGQITASPLGDDATVRRATIDPATGTYTLTVAPGTWLLSYQLSDDRYQANPNEIVQVDAAAGATTPHDFTLISLDGYVKALVLDEDGNPLPNAQVWGQYGRQQIQGETDANGVVTIYVAYSDPPPAVGALGQLTPQGRQPPPVVLGTSSPSSDTERESDTQPKGGSCENQAQRCQRRRSAQVLRWKVYPRTNGLALQAAPADTAQLQVRSANSALTGTVLSAGGAPRPGAYVAAWSEDAQWVSGVTDAAGAFSLPVVRGAAGGNRWHVTARYWDGASGGLSAVRRTLVVPANANPAVPVALGNLTLAAIAGAGPPAPQSFDFDGGNGVTITLPDQTQIVFPRNAVAPPAGSGASAFQLRASVAGNTQLPDTDLNRLAGDYGYTISLSDQQTRRPISQPLAQNAVLTLHYTDAQLARAGATAAQLRPAWYDASQASWQVASGFVFDPVARTISVETRDLGSWALVVSQFQAQIYLPLVKR